MKGSRVGNVWLRNSALSIMDQVLYSGAHFGLSLILARVMSVSEYGTFAQLYSMLVLIYMLHSSYISEPTLVYSSQYATNFSHYIGAILRMNLAFVGVIFAAEMFLLLILLPFGIPIMMSQVLAISAILPPISVMWSFRRIAYARGIPSEAAQMTLIYAAVLLVGTVLITRIQSARPIDAILIVGFAALVASVRPWRQLNSWGMLLKSPEQEFRLWMRFFLYGNWAAVAGGLIWFGNSVFFFALPIFTSVEEVGVLRAMLNVYLPFDHMLVGLSSLFIPMISRVVRMEQDGSGVRRLVIAAVWFAIVGGGVYSLSIVLLGQNVLQAFYGTKYHTYHSSVAFGAFLPLVWAVATVFRSTLRALEQPKSVFMAYLIGYVGFGAVVIPITSHYGTKGALIGMSILHLIVASMLVRYYIKGFPRWSSSFSR